MAFSDSRAWKFLHLVKNSTENALECYKFSLSRLTCLVVVVVVVDEMNEFAHSMILWWKEVVVSTTNRFSFCNL